MITTPQLPWPYRLLAYITHDNDSATVLTQRDSTPHPYVIHTMSLNDGSCYWGHYHRTRAEADDDMYRQLAPSAWRGEGV